MSRQTKPCKLNDDRALVIVNAIRKGQTRAAAAAIGGVSARALHKWLADGSPNEDGDYPTTAQGKLRASVDIADSELEGELVKSITIAATGYRDAEGNYTPGDWKAALEFLQRKNPADWAKIDRSKVELTGADGGPVEIDTSGAKDRLASMVARLTPKATDGDA